MLSFGSAALAACPDAPPSKARFNVESGDQGVTAAWLEKTLSGKKVRFDEGTEHYKSGGAYSYKSGNQTWDAPGYRFYDNGMRCIDYPSPRFDLYVVRDKQLVLINGNGGRFVGKITR
ncbi:MAG: hypothetical protein CML68_23255 [Rhodobacteraceae bacterium]|nr:hypothetical protein [Paracoccaceae bacterium]